MYLPCLVTTGLVRITDMKDIIMGGTLFPSGEQCRLKVRILTLHYPQGLEVTPWPTRASLLSKGLYLPADMRNCLTTLLSFTDLPPGSLPSWRPPWYE